MNARSLTFTVGTIISAIFMFVLFSSVNAKSLYVIANINANPTPVQTYDIQGPPNYLVFQAEADVPALAGGAVGLALDDTSNKLFITYEGSSTLQLVDANTFEVLAQTTAPGASNLAGIVVDHDLNKIYTVDRETDQLFVYSWDSDTDTLTLDPGAPFTLAGVTRANGAALDEIRDRLYIGDRESTTVRYFDTTTWTESGSLDLGLYEQTVMGIAVDPIRNMVYTGNAYQPYGSLGLLVKYDLNTDVVTRYQLPDPITDNIVGVAVDQDTGNVYATTGNQGSGGTDTTLVFDSDLNLLKDDLGVIGNPTGIAIGRASFNPLNFSKIEDQDPVVSGNDLTYTLCYDNILNVNPINNMIITDDVPAGTNFISCTGPCSQVGSTITWSVLVVPGGFVGECFDMVVNVTAVAGSSIQNLATIDSDETPPTTQVTTTDVIAPTINPLDFSKSTTVESVVTGDDLTFDLCYGNTGNTVAVSNVQISDDIPTGTVFVSATGSASMVGSSVVWDIGNLAAGAVEQCEQLVVNVTAADGSVVDNTATITSDDTAPASDSTSTPVTAEQDEDVRLKGVGGGSMGLFEILLALLGVGLITYLRNHNKASLFSVLLVGTMAAALLFPQTPAQAGSGYLGTSGGVANSDASESQFVNRLTAQGYVITGSTMDTTDTGYKIFGGYEFNKYFAVEVGYVDLGEIETTLDVTIDPGDLSQLLVDVANEHPYMASGWTLSAVGMIPVSNRVDLMGKLGMFAWDSETDIDVISGGVGSASVDDSGTDLVWGIGVKFEINPTWHIRGEWERYEVGDYSIDFPSIGVQANF